MAIRKKMSNNGILNTDLSDVILLNIFYLGLTSYAHSSE